MLIPQPKRLKCQVTNDHDLLAEDLEQLVRDCKATVQIELGQAFPEDPQEQLWKAIGCWDANICGDTNSPKKMAMIYL